MKAANRAFQLRKFYLSSDRRLNFNFLGLNKKLHFNILKSFKSQKFPIIFKFPSRKFSDSQSDPSHSISLEFLGLQDIQSIDSEVTQKMKMLANKLLKTGSSEISSESIANCLCGLQSISDEFDGSEELLEAIVFKLNHCHDKFQPSSISESLYGLQNFSSERSQVRHILAFFTPKISGVDFSPEEISRCLYGLNTMNSDCVEVENLLNEYRLQLYKIIDSGQQFDSSSVGLSFYGLLNMNIDNGIVKEIIVQLTSQMRKCSDRFSFSSISNILYGLQNHGNKDKIINNLLSVLNICLCDITSGEIDESSVCISFYGFQNMSDQDPNVLPLLHTLYNKVSSRACTFLTNREISNILYGMQYMSASSVEVKKMLNICKESLENSAECKRFLSVNELTETVFGLQSMSSEYTSVGDLIESIIPHIKTLGGGGEKRGGRSTQDEVEIIFSSGDIGMILFGIQNMNSDEDRVISLLEIINSKILNTSSSASLKFSKQDILLSLKAFSFLSSDHPVVRKLISFLIKKVRGMSEKLSLQEYCLIMESFKRLNSSNTEVTGLLSALRGKLDPSTNNASDLSADHYSSLLFGLQYMSASHEEVKLVLELGLKYMREDASEYSPSNIAKCLQGLQNMNCGVKIVKEVLNFFTLKITSSSQNFSGADIAECLSGLQSMSAEQDEVSLLLVSLQRKIEMADPDDFPPEILASCLQGLKNMNIDANVIKYTIDLLINKMKHNQTEDLNKTENGKEDVGIKFTIDKSMPGVYIYENDINKAK